MSYTPRILAFAGSTREGSFNKKFLKVAVQAARDAGAEVTLVDLRDLPLPLYDGDLEASQGLPENAVRLKSLMKSHDGFLIAAPEYNSGISGVLKNAIDWASRSEPGEASLAAFTGKSAALLSASPGALGGLRGLAMLRSILNNINVHVIPTQIALPRANDAFEADGSLKDAKTAANVQKLAKEFVEFLKKHYG